MRSYGRGFGWKPYVPVAKRRANAAREAKKLAKKGQVLRPIRIASGKIATSFWGMSWCDNLESYADWDNRLPRGRTYARNGSIVDLQITKGCVSAMVSGSSLYRIKIVIDKLPDKKWQAICKSCSTQVASLLDLLRGRLPSSVLEMFCDPKSGLFPSPKEMKFQCSCPDYAYMCKHVAAVLYGVGHLLDTEPELFFTLRNVDKSKLISQAVDAQQASDSIGLDAEASLQDEDLGAIFGIDLASSDSQSSASQAGKAKSRVKRKLRTAPARAGGSSEGAGRDKSTNVAKSAKAKKSAKVKKGVKAKKGVKVNKGVKSSTTPGGKKSTQTAKASNDSHSKKSTKSANVKKAAKVKKATKTTNHTKRKKATKSKQTKKSAAPAKTTKGVKKARTDKGAKGAKSAKVTKAASRGPGRRST